MKTASLETTPDVTLQQEYPAFLLSLLGMQKLQEIVSYLYTFQPELGFSTLHLALYKEENKHVRVEKPAPGKRILLQNNTLIEEKIFTQKRKVVLETATHAIWLAMPLHNKGKFLGAVVMQFTDASYLPTVSTWLEFRCTSLAMAVEQTWRVEILEKQVREKSMQLVVMNALTSEKDYSQMFLTIAAAINTMVPCDFLSIPAFSTNTGFLLSGYNAIRQPEGLVLMNREELLDFIGLDLQTYRESAQTDLTLYTTPRIVAGAEFVRLSEKRLITNRFMHLMGIKEAMYIPICLPNEAYATLIVCSRTEHAFSAKDLRILTDLANQITHQIGRLLAFEQKEVLETKLRQENSLLIQELNYDPTLAEIVGQSQAIKRVLEDVHKVAPTDSTVLIQGETGTGKELLARAIHNLSGRKNRPLIKVNCAALPSQLIESELFGHEKGSFTGATERRIGKFELAQGGTIFLDEIGELPLELQSKLLRVLQEYEIERIGGKQTIHLDIRVIAATNRNLRQEAAQGKFRLDLYYRLNTFPLLLPPLRERLEDIPLLVNGFADKFARKMGKTIKSIHPSVMQNLLNHSWPGNIRELEHIVEQSVIIATGSQLDVIPSFVTPITLPKESDNDTPVNFQPIAVNLDEIENAFLENQRQHILDILQETGGRIRGKSGAAQRLGLKPTTLEARMKKLGIKKNFQSI
ncbi:AAA domain-containing protein [Rhodocytophaga rosea]|uniref:AAA domain-containing protein n=1 Tax=Rhodocytophaga rosea TaxID=2704465 RepID=A0A6C0GRC1_9BACT|nr:sigma 54-interacting transcriptional regulator [Rhodocytophaga rosea]QHT70618.1 AAA domain-containing protein [Rhodocytophaga rosea]